MKNPAPRGFSFLAMPNLETEIDPDTRPLAWVKRHAQRIRAGGSVLDVACGNGRHTRYLLGLGYRVTAIDKDVSCMMPQLIPDELADVLSDTSPGTWIAERFRGLTGLLRFRSPA